MHSGSESFSTPILFIVFNRPGTTLKVFETIKQIKPARLYVAADGPRVGTAGDDEKCKEVRGIIAAVDWDCQVKTLFNEKNLGCGEAVSRAISWFFENELEGIILEDDTLPSQDFFYFCVQLLERYRNDSRVMQIGGVNLLPPGLAKSNDSYYFSNHNNIWGWASWARAWRLYDYKMKAYCRETMNRLRSHFGSIYEAAYFSFVFERTFLLPNVTWDYQWEFVRRLNSGLTIFPSSNMVTNIGFGNDATSTTGSNSPSAKLEIEQMKFPLIHPNVVLADKCADKTFFIHSLTNFRSRVKTIIKSILPHGIQERLLKAAVNRYVENYEVSTRKGENIKE